MNKETSIAFRHFERSREIFEQEFKPIFKDFSTRFAAVEMTTDLKKMTCLYVLKRNKTTQNI